MRTFYVVRVFEELNHAGGFRVDTLLNEVKNNITNQIDVGQHFLDDEVLKTYLSGIFEIPVDDIILKEKWKFNIGDRVRTININETYEVIKVRKGKYQYLYKLKTDENITIRKFFPEIELENV
jgi:hypothetical protein